MERSKGQAGLNSQAYGDIFVKKCRGRPGSTARQVLACCGKLRLLWEDLDVVEKLARGEGHARHRQAEQPSKCWCYSPVVQKQSLAVQLNSKASALRPGKLSVFFL